MDINEKTKLKIANSMKALMEHSPLSKISVKDIVEHCHLTRQTFYRYFRDKYDCVNWMYCKGSIDMTFEWVKNGMKLSEKEFAHLLIEAMPQQLQKYLLNR